MTAVEGNAPVNQVYAVSRTTGEGRAEIFRTWGPGLEQEGERGGGGGGGGRTGAIQSVRGKTNHFKGTNLTVVEGMHQSIMHILYLPGKSHNR